MRPILERLGSYLPAAIGLAIPTVFIPNANDEFILPRASIVIVGACLGTGLALLSPGGPGLGSLRLPLIAAAAGGRAWASWRSVSGRLVAGRGGDGGRPVCVHVSEWWARSAGRLPGARRLRIRKESLGWAVAGRCRCDRRRRPVGDRVRPS